MYLYLYYVVIAIYISIRGVGEANSTRVSEISDDRDMKQINITVDVSYVCCVHLFSKLIQY